MNFTPLFHPHQTLFFYSAAEVFNLLQVGQLPPDMAGIGNKIFYCYCTFIRADICIRFSMEIQIDVKNWPGEKTSELFRPNETYTLYLNIEHTVWSKSLPPAPKKWPIDKEMKISSPINFDKGYEIFGADNSLIFSPIRCPPPQKIQGRYLWNFHRSNLHRCTTLYGGHTPKNSRTPLWSHPVWKSTCFR